jgi:hypothetical protein
MSFISYPNLEILDGFTQAVLRVFATKWRTKKNKRPPVTAALRSRLVEIFT